MVWLTVPGTPTHAPHNTKKPPKVALGGLWLRSPGSNGPPVDRTRGPLLLLAQASEVSTRRAVGATLWISWSNLRDSNPPIILGKDACGHEHLSCIGASLGARTLTILVKSQLHCHSCSGNIGCGYES